MSKTYLKIVTFNVYGVYTHGKLKGTTNPKSSVQITVYANGVKDAIRKLSSQIDGAFYKIVNVIEGTFPSPALTDGNGKIVA